MNDMKSGPTAAHGLPKGFEGGFTVLMAVYGGDDPERFTRALESVFANSLPPDQMLLVVDGPVPDALETQIDKLQATELCVRVHRLPENRGLAMALNAGLALVETEWVVRADSDDINRPDRFAKQAAAINATSSPIDLLGGAIQEIDFDDAPMAVRRTTEGPENIRKFARKRNPFNHMTVAYRTAPTREVGGYPNIHLKEDYALWASLLKAGARVENLPEILVDATTGHDMYRRRGGTRYALAEFQLQQHLVRCGLKSWPYAIVHGLARSIIFLLPAPARAQFYRLVLRG
ncbi:glycosyl transferase family 2 [Thioclava sp. ES.031]|uniref:glycosyltransferase n=1 Tax=Thioclava sp. ES.031 TaxID=1798203 RepID=UPI000C01923C|nr:glycosyltransferase [Thioclava sp. ES.031]PFG62070.1 glycosyl transferase family 2 [Thioclava sp. ES.031]